MLLIYYTQQIVSIQNANVVNKRKICIALNEIFPLRDFLRILMTRIAKDQ